MKIEIITISHKQTNCYLLSKGRNFVLLDTGLRSMREQVLQELEKAGCRAGDLKLIIITHGDFDHTGNAAFLRAKYSTKIAMHNNDAGMVENADLRWNRKIPPDRFTLVGKLRVMLRVVRAALKLEQEFQKFRPDLAFEDGQSLSEYGIDARVLRLPGHSSGSIAVLTGSGDLICGDLLFNIRKPGPPFLIDDMIAYRASIDKIKKLDIRQIYPGHGNSFPKEQLPV
jgi:hydroxyacylglutathione hydrolase